MDLADLVIVLDSVGVSERKIGEIVSHRYSHATGSRITEVVQERVETLRKLRLEPCYAVIYLDALFVKVLRPEAGIRKEAMYVALGVTQERWREVLGFYLFPDESARVWGSEVLRYLWERGVREVSVFVTENL